MWYIACNKVFSLMRTLYFHALLPLKMYMEIISLKEAQVKIMLISMLSFIAVCHKYLHKCTCSCLIFYAKLALKF